MIDKTKTFNMDCMEGMKEFPDKYFDLAIVDPPYGIGEGNKKNKTRSSYTGFGDKKTWVKARDYGGGEWDDNPPNPEYFFELLRVSKNQVIWGANHFGNLSPASCWIVWDKDNGDSDQADCELAWTSFDTAVRKFRYRWQGLLQQNMKDKEDRIHPTQKPVALYKWVLKNYAKEGDKILDTHGGSMSSVIACLDMGFPITCFELDTDYYNQAKLRIINHLKQLNAFRPAYDIEFHDNTGISTLRNQPGIGYQEQKNGANKEAIYRIDGLFHDDSARQCIEERETPTSPQTTGICIHTEPK